MHIWLTNNLNYLHNDSLTTEGDRKYTSSLLSEFIKKKDCGKDVEKQLDFYCECRSTFRNLESVKVLSPKSTNYCYSSCSASFFLKLLVFPLFQCFFFECLIIISEILWLLFLSFFLIIFLENNFHCVVSSFLNADI